uniref:Uncharacterized protein n=1 Tax=Trichinella nativa TaxID=6335 RepID=A0A0V1KIN8_9BILA
MYLTPRHLTPYGVGWAGMLQYLHGDVEGGMGQIDETRKYQPE